MDTVGLLLVIMGAVLLSRSVQLALPVSIPLPLIQIAFGALIAVGFEQSLHLEPDVFFFVFLPPLLFMDGWRIPKDALKQDSMGIFVLSVVLVILTVIGLGYLLHWLIPVMPLPVAFALAAIVSPTDVVAFSSITQKLPVPPRALAILEGEALFNDASGLVAFQLAVAAMVTGLFSFTHAIQSFLWVALVGLLTGYIVVRVLVGVRDTFTRFYGEDTGSEILFSLLMPFVAYLVAEQVDASGILAAVMAGITMSRSELSARESSSTRVQRRVIFDALQLTLNGMMFVLLGEQLPKLLAGATTAVQESQHDSAWWLLIYTLVICTCLVIMRFALISGYLFMIKRVPRYHAQLPTHINLAAVSILTLGGVRGALTLAGVLTLPLLLGEAPFPARDLTIFLAAAVIIVSLLIATFGLPFALKRYLQGKTPRPLHSSEAVQHAKTIAYDAARASLHEQLAEWKQNPANENAVYAEQHPVILRRVLAQLEASLGLLESHDSLNEVHQAYVLECELLQSAIESARVTIFQLARDKTISDEVARELIHRLDQQETPLRE